VLSAIYMPYFKDLYFAKKDKGAYKNGKRIHCSNRKDITHTWGTIGIFTGNVKIDKVKRLLDQSKLHLWFSDLGSISFCSMYAAEGKKEWFITPSLKGSLWDYAPISLILEESGCKITDLEGNKWKLKGKRSDYSMIAANPFLHKQLVNILRSRK
jgi:myo-inositol-1(or 4)-monophosphatase